MVVIKDDTNIVNLTGELEDNLEFSHEIFGEKFFNTKIKIKVKNKKNRKKITKIRQKYKKIKKNNL